MPTAIVPATTTNEHLARWVDKMASLMQPSSIHWVDGSKEEYDWLCHELVEKGTFKYRISRAIPEISDTNPLANPRGLRLGSNFLMGQHGHPQSQLQWISYSNFRGISATTHGDRCKWKGRSVPYPTGSFLETLPIAKMFLTTQKPAPVSYATTPYFGVTSFTSSASQPPSPPVPEANQ
jgi:phosphoenolpyruvate carboxykinase-like protein